MITFITVIHVIKINNTDLKITMKSRYVYKYIYLFDQYVDHIMVFGKRKPKKGHNLLISHDEKGLE